MLDQLRAWINGKQDYSIGVALFAAYSSNEKLLEMFQRGKNDYSKKRLHDELLSECRRLKAQKPTVVHFEPGVSLPKQKPFTLTPLPPAEALQAGLEATVSAGAIILDNPNPDLYAACIADANNAYKEAMNARAELFAMAKSDSNEDINRPDLVHQRSDLAISVVRLYNKASDLFDIADHVKEHGQLPGGVDEPEPGTDDIPDHLVKQSLDNARKNFNKMKTKPTTPERVVSMQALETKIKILEERWLSLKQK